MSHQFVSLNARRLPIAVVAVVTLFSAAVGAHDLWIEPTHFTPEEGKLVGVRLLVGVDMQGDPLPRDPALINQFVVVDGSGRKPVVGRDGSDPAGLLRTMTPGLQIVGYFSRPSSIVLPAEKFNEYVNEEGLDTIAALRASRHQTDAEAHEVFVRCAKSLLLSGPVKPEQADRALGFTLELVAERNPYKLAAGQALPVRLTYEGRPLAGALVMAVNRANPKVKLAMRSDVNGRVAFKLPQDGMWLIKAVHMVEAPADSGAQWASFWASLTFELNRRASHGSSR
jgi:uncharacterized GH25 family protein